MGVRERTAVLLFLNRPMRIEALQRKAQNVILVKIHWVLTESFYAHSSPGFLPTPIHSSPPFSPLPFAVPTPDSRAIFPNPKHLIEQLGFLTCGLICSLNTWLIQKAGIAADFFLPPLLLLILGCRLRGGHQSYRVCDILSLCQGVWRKTQSSFSSFSPSPPSFGDTRLIIEHLFIAR